MSKKELLFTVDSGQCEWSYTKGTGAGGQKKNKTSSAVHCHHRPSGAHGYSEESRSQHDNKRSAFLKMAETEEFKKWHQIEVWRRLGVLEQIEKAVQDGMNPRHLKLEVKSEDGRWVQVPFDSIPTLEFIE